jgi:hypothetical protein
MSFKTWIYLKLGALALGGIWFLIANATGAPVSAREAREQRQAQEAQQRREQQDAAMAMHRQRFDSPRPPALRTPAMPPSVGFFDRHDDGLAEQRQIEREQRQRDQQQMLADARERDRQLQETIRQQQQRQQQRMQQTARANTPDFFGVPSGGHAGPPRQPRTPPTHDNRLDADEPGASPATPTPTVPAGPVRLTPSSTYRAMLGDPVQVSGLSINPPAELRQDAASSRVVRWRGVGNVSTTASLGLEMMVLPRTSRDPEGLPQREHATGQTLVRIANRWTPIEPDTVSETLVGDTEMLCVEEPRPEHSDIQTVHYSGYLNDRHVTLTLRYDSNRPQQRDLLEAAVATLAGG